MKRIKELFDRKKTSILSIYFTAGFPLLEDTLQIIRHLDQSGVDLIEIGFPFSDPLADGPIIQHSNEIALENGMTLEVLFGQLEELRNITQLPILLMGYLNPVLQFGFHNFLEKCHQTGIDGIIIPDMPLHYYKDNMRKLCVEKQIATIFLITPQTSISRIYEIDDCSKGFIYMVSTTNITGEKGMDGLNTRYLERTQNLDLRNPLLAGFGIDDSNTFKAAGRYSSGCIVGSAFIKHLDKYGSSENKIRQFISNIQS